MGSRTAGKIFGPTQTYYSDIFLFIVPSLSPSSPLGNPTQLVTDELGQVGRGKEGSGAVTRKQEGNKIYI